MRRWLRKAFSVQQMRERRVLWHSLPEGPLESRCVLIIHLIYMISLLRAYACLEALHTVCVSDDVILRVCACVRECVECVLFVCMHIGHKSVCRKKSKGTDGGGAERRDSQSGFSGGPQCTTLVSLYVYDLSQGFAKRMSQSLLGKQARYFGVFVLEVVYVRGLLFTCILWYISDVKELR